MVRWVSIISVLWRPGREHVILIPVCFRAPSNSTVISLKRVARSLLQTIFHLPERRERAGAQVWRSRRRNPPPQRESVWRAGGCQELSQDANNSARNGNDNSLITS